ncbi:MAG: hypothetical protein WAM78_08170 [Candidatus Sulfotelmatobacter sp.]
MGYRGHGRDYFSVEPHATGGCSTADDGLVAAARRYGICRGYNRRTDAFSGWFGRALFEMVVEPEDATLSLVSFGPDYVWSLPFFYLQVAPRSSLSNGGRRYAVLRSDAVWRVDMPRELGGTSGFRRVLNGLGEWPSLGPGFYQSDLERGEFSKEFVFGDYRRAYQIQLYRVTRNWGWAGRDWSLDNVTEYYQFYRHLTFRWAQSVLREHVVRQFNFLFRGLGISAQIVIEGLSSPSDILRVRDEMKAGSLDFSAATKAIRS